MKTNNWTNNIYHRWGVFYFRKVDAHVLIDWQAWLLIWFASHFCQLTPHFTGGVDYRVVSWSKIYQVFPKFRSWTGLQTRNLHCKMFLSIFSHLEEQHIYCQCPLLLHCDPHLGVAAAIAGVQAYCFLYCYDNCTTFALVKHSLLECTNRLITYQSYLKT